VEVNSSQSLSISFAYVATPSGRESLQSFRIAMFLEEGKCYWYRDYRLVRVRDVYLSFSTRLLFSTRSDVYLRL
jgi:hypothetical protein